jgi:predicted RNase H-like nuclease (RuvC/YqgF family)
MNERTPYKPVKPVDRSSEIDELRKKMEKLYEELEELKREKEELKGSKISLTPQQVQEEMDELIEKAKRMVKYGSGIFCPICNRNRLQNACLPYATVSEKVIVYGVQCNDEKTRGFYSQGEYPIPKHLREYF